MKKILFVSMLALGACGDKGEDRVVEVPVEVEVPGPTIEVPGPERIVEVMIPPPELPPVSCQVFKDWNVTTLPTIHQVKGDLEVGLQNLKLLEVADDNLPFAAFVGTMAELVTKNFALRCSFKYEVTQAGSHKFTLTSDDGSELYVNGSRLINNGGAHGMLAKTGSVTLPVGVHELRLHYYEGSGPKGLSLTVQEPSIVPNPHEF